MRVDVHEVVFMNRERAARPWAALLTLTLVPGLFPTGAIVAHAQPGAPGVAPAPYVRVLVDGQPVSFDVPPVVALGRVLVPLRGVFHRLGAIVTWDPASQTVLAARGDTSIVLRIGDTQAHINGQPTLMDVPALLAGGRTMVPLRFISQALGSQVSWDAASTTVQIASQPYGLPPSQAYPPPAPPAVPAPISGTLLSAKADAPSGEIEVLVDKAVHTYKVTPATTISRIDVANNAGGSEALSALRAGDHVQVTADSNGVAQSIHATYKEVAGRIIAVTEAGVVVLENGDTYRLNRSARVTRDGRVVDAAALRPGDDVQLRLNPQSNEIWAAAARQRAEPHRPAIASVVVTPSGRELHAGDAVKVTATGVPGGRAAFSIAGLRANVPMVESTSERGTYYGSYVVQPGDVAREGEVTVRLAASNGEIFEATAQTRVHINAARTPPPAAGVPIITSPSEGATISAPFIVTGRSRPGSRVKVTAEYDGSALLFKVGGSLGTHTVTVDRKGEWSVKFTDEPPVSGLNVSITAVEVDEDDRPLAAATTVVTTIR
jgi:hypothetical protein